MSLARLLVQQLKNAAMMHNQISPRQMIAAQNVRQLKTQLLAFDPVTRLTIKSKSIACLFRHGLKP